MLCSGESPKGGGRQLSFSHSRGLLIYCMGLAIILLDEDSKVVSEFWRRTVRRVGHFDLRETFNTDEGR